MSIDRGLDKEDVLDKPKKNKKNEMTPFAAMWMDIAIILQREVSQRKTNIMS